MTFTKRLREPIMRGEITCSVRIWQRPHVKVGGRYALGSGFVEVTSIKQIELTDITPALARRSGFAGVVDLLKIAKHGPGENVYLIDFEYRTVEYFSRFFLGTIRKSAISKSHRLNPRLDAFAVKCVNKISKNLLSEGARWPTFRILRISNLLQVRLYWRKVFAAHDIAVPIQSKRIDVAEKVVEGISIKKILRA
jgi:hypothetical protein